MLLGFAPATQASMDRPIAVLDTETAASRGAPHLVELAALRVVEGEVVDRFESLVRPEVPIAPEAGAVHGIGERDVASAPPAHEVLPAFLEWLGDDWLAAHDARKDARVLAFELARARLGPPAAPWICTLRLSRRLFPEAADHRLETLCELLGLEDGPRHRALADAAWAHQVLLACAERVEAAEGAEPGLERLLVLCGGAPITVGRCAPAAPRLKPRWRSLSDACARRAPLVLVYGSGAEPPAELPVAPRLLFSAAEHGYLEAECLKSGTIKTYRLDRIQRVLEAR
jgi:DNA polymerase-3 subunit epsilon